MRWFNALTTSLRQIPALRRWANRYGRSWWKLPSLLRRRVYWEASAPRLPGAQTWRFGRSENVPRADAIDGVAKPTLGHLLAAHTFRTRTPFVTRLDEAWLVGKYASPVTMDGRLILSAFRDEPRMLGLERHPDLEAWLGTPALRASEQPELVNVCSMVNRLQTNYYHWLIEWCGRLELIEAYREETGCAPKLLIPKSAPRFVRESLTLLGFGPESWIPWAEDSAPRKVRQLVLPSLRESDVTAAPLGPALAAPALPGGGGSRRRKSRIESSTFRGPREGWRSVLNDEEIADWFRSEGHEVLQPHRFPLAEQIRRFSRASLVVGLHGAGLTNILFAPGAALLELTGDYGDGVYFGMAARLDQTYDTLSCRSIGDDVEVDLETLKQRVQRHTTRRRLTGEPAHV